MGISVRLIGGIDGPKPQTPRTARTTGADRLTDAACRAANPHETAYKLRDGRGLYLVVQPNGSKLWRLDYRLPGKKNKQPYSIGAYPENSIKTARAERDRAREWVRQGLNPTIQRRVAKATNAATQATSFALVAEEWFGKKTKEWSLQHRQAQRSRLDRELLPQLGGLPIADIRPAQLLETLRRIEQRGAHEVVAKCRILLRNILAYAVNTNRVAMDPTTTLAGAFTRPAVVNRATIAASEMPNLFKALAAVPAELNTKLACYWLILTASRTGEIRFATWGEIDGKRWRIPGARMKMKREHVVPLSRQAEEVLQQAQALRTSDGSDALIFPGFTRAGSLSENALLALLARAGFFGRQTTHGFRASFSTWAHEVQEADPDVIEACLAHVKEGVRGIYNRSTYLSRRLELLQAWSDQCTAWGMRLP